VVNPAGTIAGKPWESLAANSDVEVGPWLAIAPDDTVTIRIGQSEMGQSVIASCAQRLPRSWNARSKVRAEYVSVNRYVRENKVYKRLATTSSSSVRLGRRTYKRRAPAHESGFWLPLRSRGACQDRNLWLRMLSSLTGPRAARFVTGT
jgi:hypothetical protein